MKRLILVLSIASLTSCAGVGHESVIRLNPAPQETATTRHPLSPKVLGSSAVACALSKRNNPDNDEKCGVSQPHYSLSLAGGGYRAALFHYGAIKYLNDSHQLQNLRMVCSTSGGSITGAGLVLNWNKLDFSQDGFARNLDDVVGSHLLDLTRKTTDANVFLTNLATIGHAGRTIAPYLEKSPLFKDRYLSDLPNNSESPLLVMISTDFYSGKVFPISRDYVGNDLLSAMKYDFKISQAIAASAGFPPILGPIKFEMLEPKDSASKIKLRTFFLGDGGVFDNLGVIYCAQSGIQYISNAANPENTTYQESDLISASFRSVEIMHSLLVSRIYDSHCLRPGRKCWSLAEDKSVPYLDDKRTDEIFTGARIPTRLKALSTKTQCDLINAGYLSAEASFRGSEVGHREVSLPCSYP